jgi:hypothetical protein
LRQSSIITQRGGKNVFLPLELVQLCILRLGFVQDGDVRVGVFPEGKEVVVGGNVQTSNEFQKVLDSPQSDMVFVEWTSTMRQSI